MKKIIECFNISDIRDSIDEIDENIVRLIALRSQYVTAAAGFKKNRNDVAAPERVAAVMESKRKLASDLEVSPELIEGIYRYMIGFFIESEKKEWEKHMK